MSLPRLTYTKAARELNGLKTINLDVTIGDTPENSATVATNFQLTHYQQGQVMCFLKQIHSTPTNCTLTKFSITYGELNATSQSRQWFKVLMGRDAVRLREGMKVALTRSFRAGCRLEEEDDKDTFVWEAEKGEVLSWIF